MGTFFKKYADFQGRARRKEYWMNVLSNLISPIVLTIILSALHAVWIGTLIDIFMIVPNFSCLVRRLHDTNRSGWWAFVPLVPIFFLVQQGDVGENQYGPDPKIESND